MSRILLLLLALLATAAAPDTQGIGFDQHPGATLPLDAAFTDQAGRAVTLRELLGRGPALLVLGYYHCPTLCGVVRDDAVHAAEGTGLDPELIDLSIDPRETPADARAALASLPGAHPGWHFLTGQAAAITAVAQAAGFRYRWDDQLRQFIHPTGMVILTPAGRIAAYALGVGYPSGDLRGALLRAQDGAIAAAASPILLLCFHFDPTTGRYSLAVLKLVRLAGVLTVLSLGGALWLLHRTRPA